MKLTKRSSLTGNEHTMELNVTQEQLSAWQNGGLIQNIMPNLTPWEREFVMTGTTKEEWDETFAEEEDDDDDSYSS